MCVKKWAVQEPGLEFCETRVTLCCMKRNYLLTRITRIATSHPPPCLQVSENNTGQPHGKATKSFIALYVQYLQLLLTSAAHCLIWSSSAQFASWMRTKVFFLQCHHHFINPGSPFAALCVVTVLWSLRKAPGIEETLYVMWTCWNRDAATSLKGV